MMTSLRALASATIREGIRTQVFANLGIVALFGMALAAVLDELAVGTRGRVLADVAVGAGSLINALLCTTQAVRALGAEEERHALLTILVRPVSRAQVVVGRCLGVVGLGWMNAVALGLLTSILLVRLGAEPGDGWRVTATLALESLIIPAVTMVFASVSGATVSVMLGLGVWAAGLLSPELIRQAQRAAGASSAALKAAHALIPNLAGMDLVAHPDMDPWMVGYAVAYSGACLALAATLFAGRDIR